MAMDMYFTLLDDQGEIKNKNWLGSNIHGFLFSLRTWKLIQPEVEVKI